MLFYDHFAVQILLAQEAKLVSQVEVAESNALLDDGLATLLPNNVCVAYVSCMVPCRQLYVLRMLTIDPCSVDLLHLCQP